MAESRQERKAETAFPPTVQNVVSPLRMLGKFKEGREKAADIKKKKLAKIYMYNLMCCNEKRPQITYLKALSVEVERQVP